MNYADAATYEKAYGGNLPQIAYFYDANDNLEYVGIGEWGAATSEAKWRIFRVTYGANSLIATQKSTKRYQILDDMVSGVTYG